MNLMHKGKAKSVYEKDMDTVLIEFRDDITAGDGAKKETIAGKGALNAEISAWIFELLEKSRVKTHFLGFGWPNKHIAKKVEIVPVEVICRNIATGSLLKRYPFREGQKFNPPVIEFGYKSDEYHDPMVNTDIALALDLVKNKEELEKMREVTLRVNSTLKDFLLSKSIILVDFKLEFGYDAEGNLLLADEISPDTCRFWDAETKEIMDKDRFRKDMGSVVEFYREVKSRLES
jgi:phosphoribosylaminoimidazole-succinocarboxamide synthase